MKLLMKAIRKIKKKIYKYDGYTEQFVDYHGQAANDFIREKIQNCNGGLMIAKFGGVELNSVCSAIRKERGYSKEDIHDYLRGKGEIYPEDSLKTLCLNAGFFPKSLKKQAQYSHLVINDIKNLDILASYIDQESYLADELAHVKRVDLEGFYAPYLWKNPWTSTLKGKKVLVIHPFSDEIQEQYKKRTLLFSDPEVLPEFKSLTVIRAVQSIANNGKYLPYSDWFDALESMEKKMDAVDFDVLIVGCGAYGFDLAAYAKRKNKIAIHLAGWTQMLFGIYGNRWINDQPKFRPFINDSWIRPKESSIPKGASKIEHGAYW